MVTPIVLTINLVAFWLRHALFASIAFTLCAVASRWGLLRKIQTVQATSAQMAREAAGSALSAIIFVGSMGLLLAASQHGYTRIYHDFSAHGTAWFFASIGCMLLLHDAYFYWTHRLRHEVKLFWRAHHFHHTFSNPTPWAAFASTPAEALIEAGVLPLIVWTFPIHPAALYCFTSILTAQSVALHCGFEFGRGRKWTLWMGSRAHNDHHQGARGNYGLYTTLWDLAMGTYVPSREESGGLQREETPHASAA